MEFQAIPVNFTHMPVLLMRPNTAAQVCVVYRGAWTGNGSFYFSNVISKATCYSTPQASGCYYNDSHSFDVVAYPNSVQAMALVSEVTITYSVFAHPNATGFYDRTFIYACESPRLAVGYSAQQVNTSDFATIPLHSCFNAVFVPVLITVSGMDITYLGINAGPK